MYGWSALAKRGLDAIYMCIAQNGSFYANNCYNDN